MIIEVLGVLLGVLRVVAVVVVVVVLAVAVVLVVVILKQPRCRGALFSQSLWQKNVMRRCCTSVRE